MSKSEQFLNNLQEDYLFECAICGHEQRAVVSIFMQLGVNSGHGNCLQCETFLHLEVAGDAMVSREWNEWYKEEYSEKVGR